MDDVLDRAKWETEIPNHSGNPRRKDEYVGKRVMVMEVPGEKKGRKTGAEVVG